MTEDEIVLALNELAANQPTPRALQRIKDGLTEEAVEMLRVMVEECQP